MFIGKNVLTFVWLNVYLCAADHLEDHVDFQILPIHQELLGDRAKDCDIAVSIEKTGLEDSKGQYTLSYVLFRCVCVFLKNI